MSDELKLAPCPFCGGREASVCERDNLNFVMCENCTAEGPAMEGVQSSLDAANEWNRRATPSPSTAPIAEDERAAFEAWARDHLGQGYPLTMDEHTYEHPVSRWAFKAWQAGRRASKPAAREADTEVDHDAEMFAMLEADTAQEGAIHEMDGAATWAALQGWLCARRTYSSAARVAARQSIDTPEFREMVQKYIDGGQSWGALIAHIDTWGARRDGNGVPAVLANGYKGSTMVSDIAGPKITLRYDTSAHADAAHEILCKLIDAAAPVAGNTAPEEQT